MPNIKYDKEKVLEITAEYFFTHDKESFIHLPFEKVYEDIKKYALKNHKRVKMPQFSQMRKILIAHLTEYELYTSGEHLTTEVAFRITDSYYNSDEIEYFLYNNNYDVTIYSQSPIICTIKLPPVEVLDMLAISISDEKNKSCTWGRINLIHHLCQKIRKKNPDLILAVIPQLNRMVYLNRNGKISNEINQLNPVCDTLCMFVKNTPEGHAFVKKMKNSPHSLTDIAK